MQSISTKKNIPLYRIVMQLTLVSLIMTGCTQPNANVPSPSLLNVAASELLLEENDLPEHWYAQPCIPYCERSEGRNTALRSFLPELYEPAHAYQEVYRLPDVQAAQTKFSNQHKMFSQNDALWQTPVDATYKSLLADEQAFRCGTFEIPVCRVLITYHNYYIYFLFAWDRGNQDRYGLTIDEIEYILHSFDQKLATQFQDSQQVINTQTEDDIIANNSNTSALLRELEVVRIEPVAVFPSSHLIGHEGDNAIDGSTSTYWASMKEKLPYITLRFDGRKVINRIELYVTKEQVHELQHFTLIFSDSTTQEGRVVITEGWNTITFDPKSTVLITMLFDNTDDIDGKGLEISEIITFGHH